MSHRSASPPSDHPADYCIGRVFWFRAVVDFVTALARSKTLTVARLKRALNKAMAAHASPTSAPVPAPSALDVEAMFHPRMFAAGSIPFSTADRKLDPGFVSSQVSTLLASGVVSEASDIFRAYSPLLLNPLGVVFRPSDRAQARIRLRAEIASQEDLDAVNTAFAASGDKQLAQSQAHHGQLHVQAQ